MNTFEKISTVINVVMALGTIVLAILALFGDYIRNLIFKPKLEVKIDNKEPFVEKILVEASADSTTKADKEINIRIKVANTGSITAKSCTALVTAIYQKRQGDSSYYKEEIVPAEFLWIKGRKASEHKKDVPPELSAYIAFARIEEDQEMSSDNSGSTTPASNYSLSLMIETLQPGEFYKIKDGIVIVKVILTAENCKDHLVNYIKILWKGKSLADIDKDAFFNVELIKENNLEKEGVKI